MSNTWVIIGIAAVAGYFLLRRDSGPVSQAPGKSASGDDKRGVFSSEPDDQTSWIENVGQGIESASEAWQNLQSIFS